MRKIIIILLLVIFFLVAYIIWDRPKIEMALAAKVKITPLGAMKIIDGKEKKLTLHNAETPFEYRVRKNELVNIFDSHYKKNKQGKLLLGGQAEELNYKNLLELFEVIRKEIRECPIQGVAVNGDIKDPWVVINAFNSHIIKNCL